MKINRQDEFELAAICGDEKHFIITLGVDHDYTLTATVSLITYENEGRRLCFWVKAPDLIELYKEIDDGLASFCGCPEWVQEAGLGQVKRSHYRAPYHE